MNAGGEVRRVTAPAPLTRPAVHSRGDDLELEQAEVHAPPTEYATDEPSTPANGELPARPGPSWTAWLAEGRMHLSIGWIGGSIAGVALVLVLFVTFQAGTRFATPAPPAPREPLKPETASAPPRDSGPGVRQAADLSVSTPPRNTPTTPGSVTPGGPAPAVAPRTPQPALPPPAAETSEPAAAPAEVASDAFDFEAGAYYLVIQHFHRDQGDAAKQAREFLKSNGVECILKVGTKDLRLFATRPFRLSGGEVASRKAERTALDELKKRVKDLGKEYTRTRARGYAFDQCYELKQ
jgi:hypothetical protein